jgi:hypothetical protein
MIGQFHVGQLHGRAFALPKFIRHVKTFPWRQTRAVAPNLSCRGAVRIFPLRSHARAYVKTCAERRPNATFSLPSGSGRSPHLHALHQTDHHGPGHQV